MTTVRQVITRAAQIAAEANEGQPAPSAYFANSVALPRYNTMIRSLFGHGIGFPLSGYRPTTSENVEAGGHGYARRYFVGSTALTLTLPADACDGDWFGVTDTNAGLSTYNITIARNSWLLEGAASNLTLATNGTAREWFFRADTGNWQRVTDLTLDDTVYFPDDIVHGLPAMLALHLVPLGYAGSDVLAAESAAAREKIAQRYAPRVTTLLDDGVRAGEWTRIGFDINRGW